MKGSLFILGLALPAIGAWFFPHSSHLQEVDAGLSPRFFGLFKNFINPFSYSVARPKSAEPPPPPVTTTETECERFGGQPFGDQCVEFIPSSSTFFEATHFCRGKGGSLWAPALELLNHPFLFQKLLRYFPKVFSGMKGGFFIGISKGMNTGYVDINGVDVSEARWVQTNDEPAMKDVLCAVFDYSLGHLQFQPVKCEASKNFVCEYPAKANIPYRG